MCALRCCALTALIGSGGSRKTKIASFKFGNSPSVTTLPPTNVMETAATLNGSLNPNGLPTDYHFEWGTTLSYGNTTPVVAAGSGLTTINVLADISGLTGGVTYHFRLSAVNSDGTTNGNDVTFAPGAAIVTTTAITGITMNSAISGGNVTTEGGSPVTARGVCWSTTANPVATGNHTSDGSGSGSYTSAITGLSSMTTYHVRAYATNGNGTFYGDDLQFTTLCGIITVFPYNEGFENGGSIPACWSKEFVTGSLDWIYQAGGHNAHPAAAHAGSFNALLYQSSTAVKVTKLVTPAINLTGLINPQLKFWHAQALWVSDQDELRVYYKTSPTGSWTLLAAYTANITAWTQETITLPNPSSTYFIAFEGTAKYGYGVCLDDVSVTGTTPTLTVTPANQNVTSMAGITNFSVTSNTSWTASSNVPSWCMVTPSGSGNGTVTATYDQNTTYLQRIATVTVTVTGLPPVDVTVTQAPTVPPPPFALQASIAGNKVMLTWSEPVGAIGLTGYNVYRGITKLTPEPVTDTAYTDTVPAPGTYEYTVTAVYGDLESVGSSPVSATIVATSVSMAPDRSECVGDTLYIPVYVTAMNLDSLAFYISYDHSLMIPAGVPYTSLDPRFTVAGFFPEYATGTMALFMKETGTTGTDLSGEKIIELVFQLASDGITPMLFNDNLDLPPISALYNPSGIGITPVSYTGNQVVVNALPASAGSVSGTSTVVAGTAGVDFSVAAIDRAVYYSWNLPPGVTIATGAGTASITADFSSTAVSGIINVSGGNLCGYGLPSSGFEVTVIPVVPALRTVENVIVPSGQSPCYDATDTITIAGNSTYFTLEPGGSATFIAGKKIIFLPDVTIPEGGYLLAYITETNSFCGSLPPAMVTSAQEPGEKPGCVQTGVQGCKVYPNPTTGKFVIELNAPSNSTLPVVSIFGLMGETVFREELSGVVKKEISLEGKPSGIYFLHVISEDTRFTMKIIKQ